MPALSSRPRVPARPKTQSNIEWIEIPIFIHGISPDKFPATSKREYAQLLDRVSRALKSENKSGFSSEPIYIVWGIPTTPPQTKGNDQYLAEVERDIEGDVRKRMGSAYGIPWPFFGIYSKVRDFFFYGVSDLFYYVSSDGEYALREHIFKYIAQNINKLDRGKNLHFSLTLFGHSAGSVIAHDLLFHLFSNKTHETKGTDMYAQMEKLRKMVKGGRLRLRRLYTFGSPISPLTLRADSLLNIFRADRLLDPKDIGLGRNDKLSVPRWVNFWSRYDLASYPVEFLYSNTSGMIHDQEIHSSISPAAAHAGYWKSNEMAEYIAKTF
jgi:hypothetical protein